MSVPLIIASVWVVSPIFLCAGLIWVCERGEKRRAGRPDSSSRGVPFADESRFCWLWRWDEDGSWEWGE